MKSYSGKHASHPACSPVVPVTVVIIFVIVGLIVGLSVFRNKHNDASDTVPVYTDAPVEKNTDTIDIPGYEALAFQAGSKTQSISLSNPPQNSCYFRISLLLEDGTLLWMSDLIAPGYGSKEITLSKELKEGSYPNSVLRYECFSLDEELHPLNGAETKLTIIAR